MMSSAEQRTAAGKLLDALHERGITLAVLGGELVALHVPIRHLSDSLSQSIRAVAPAIHAELSARRHERDS